MRGWSYIGKPCEHVLVFAPQHLSVGDQLSLWLEACSTISAVASAPVEGKSELADVGKHLMRHAEFYGRHHDAWSMALDVGPAGPANKVMQRLGLSVLSRVTRTDGRAGWCQAVDRVTRRSPRGDSASGKAWAEPQAAFSLCLLAGRLCYGLSIL